MPKETIKCEICGNTLTEKVILAVYGREIGGIEYNKIMRMSPMRGDTFLTVGIPIEKIHLYCSDGSIHTECRREGDTRNAISLPINHPVYKSCLTGGIACEVVSVKYYLNILNKNK